MPQLRINTWERAFKAAMNLLSQSSNPIARYTAEIIQSKKVTVLPLKKIAQESFDKVIKHLIDDTSEYKNTVVSNSMIDKIESKNYGVYYKNRIYIRTTMTDPVHFSKILAHEVNHYLNKEKKLEENDEIFLDELRAKISEKMTESKPITRSYIKKIADKIANSYELTLPKKVSFPEGVYYPIPKKLR